MSASVRKPGAQFSVVGQTPRTARQRVAIQRDGSPARPLAPGPWRVSDDGRSFEPITDLTPIRSAVANVERRVAELAGIADSVRALELRIRRLEVAP